MGSRKNNGGHSTKSKGLDRRKNPFRNAIANAITPKELEEVIQMLYKKSVTKQDVNAAKTLLEYTVTKPVQVIEQANVHRLEGFDINRLYDKKA